jgi:tRNA pseudouridine38-40 synthase
VHRYALTLVYKGTSFYGWQKCQEGLTIEEDLDNALKRLIKSYAHLQAASRTDRGVHAEGQVATFDTRAPIDCHKIALALNSLTHPDLFIKDLKEVDSSFHPSLDARGKEYHYLVETACVLSPIERDFFWHFPYPVIFEKIIEGAELLEGTHEFKAFTNVQKSHSYESTIRTITSLKVDKEGSHIRFKIEGDRFLYKMVRNIVGTLMFVGRGKLSLSQIPLLLQGGLRCESGMTAPAHGLSLKKIFINLDKSY